MRPVNKTIIALLIGFTPLLAFSAYYCASVRGRGFISEGDSMAKVQQACGAPTHVSEANSPAPSTLQVQYWTYTHTPVEDRFGSEPSPTDVAYPKPVKFEVIDGKVTSIEVEGKSVSKSNLCRTGMMVSIGATIDDLNHSCGRADFVNAVQKNINSVPSIRTTWIYDKGPNVPAMVLEFDNGILTSVSNP